MVSLERVTEEAPPPPAKRRQAPRGHQPRFDARTYRYQVCGVDLTSLDGMAASSALALIAEIGTDMGRWPSSKHFASWLGLCPGTRISGGKVLSSKSKPSANRAAGILRMAAASLYHGQSALGAYYRRLAGRRGKAAAVTATAHKLARIIYSMLKQGTAYTDAGQDYYEQQYKQRMVRSLERRAQSLGFELVPTPQTSVT